MTRIKGQLTTADYLSIDDYWHLVDGLHNDGSYFWELFCRLAFCTALRGNDVLSLYWSDILGKEKTTIREPKTNKKRSIRFHSSVIQKIQELYELLGSPPVNRFIFYNEETKRHYTLEYVNRTLKKFRVKYRLPIKAFSTHTFRKTFGRYIWELNGRNSESLIKLCRVFQHSSLDITMVYLGIRQDEIDAVYETVQF